MRCLNLGSTTTVTNASGTVAASYQYDAYSRPRQTDDTIGNPMRFAGLPTDTSTGLVEDRARLYDPTTGDFLTPDPLGGGYAYAGDSPANFVDPTGTMYAHAPESSTPISTGDPVTSLCTRYCGKQGSWSGTTGGGTGTAATGSGGTVTQGSTSTQASPGTGGVNSGECWASVALLLAGLVFSVIGVAADLEPLADAIFEAHSVLPLDTVGVLMHGNIFDQLSLVADIFGMFLMNVIGPMLGLWGTVEAGVRMGTLATPAGIIATAIVFAASLLLGIGAVISSCSGD